MSNAGSHKPEQVTLSKADNRDLALSFTANFLFGLSNAGSHKPERVTLSNADNRDLALSFHDTFDKGRAPKKNKVRPGKG